jgi:CIC family chloride channel protein
VSSTAYGVSALLLRRSVLTEKIARRGYHLSREYDVDPLEVLLTDEVMHPAPAVLTVTDLLPPPAPLLLATVPRQAVLHGSDPSESVDTVLVRDPLVVHADDTLRTVASRFAADGVTAAPVVGRHHPETLLG